MLCRTGNREGLETMEFIADSDLHLLPHLCFFFCKPQQVASLKMLHCNAVVFGHIAPVLSTPLLLDDHFAPPTSTLSNLGE